jgi:hypothetical protein
MNLKIKIKINFTVFVESILKIMRTNPQNPKNPLIAT